MGSLRHGLRRVANRFCALSGSASHAYTPRHATEPRVGRIGAQSVAPPPSATAPTYVASPGSHCLDRNPAAATLPWCPPPAWVGNHDNTRSTTVVLGPEVGSYKDTIYEVLRGETPATQVLRSIPAVPGLDVLPANITLAAAEAELLGSVG